jgi:hypothetical protein
LLADGESYSTIEAVVPCCRDYINRWRRRFLADGLDGLRARYLGQQPRVLTPALEARILEHTRQRPPDGSTHWSTRTLARVLKIGHTMVPERQEALIVTLATDAVLWPEVWVTWRTPTAGGLKTPHGSRLSRPSRIRGSARTSSQ